MKIRPSIKSDHKKIILEKLGHVLMIDRCIKQYHGKNDFWLFHWLQPAITFNQLQVFFAEDDTPIGFVAWAYLEEDVQNRLIENPKSLLHPSEWTEGVMPWIIDCVALPGCYRKILRYSAETLFKDNPQIGYIRRRIEGDKLELCKAVNPHYEGKANESL